VSAQEAIQPGTPTVTLVLADSIRLTGDVDSNSPVVWDRIDGDPTVVVFTSFAGQPRRSAGSSILKLSTARPVDVEPWPAGGVWMEAILPDVDGTWYGFYHLERIPAETRPDTEKAAPQIGAARSTDRGVTWTDLGIVIDASTGTYECDTANTYFVGGVGDLTALIDPAHRDVYLYYSQYGRDLSQQGVGVARLAWADRDAPAGKVSIWNDGAWLSPLRIESGRGDDGGQPAPRFEYPTATSIFPLGDSWHDDHSAVDAFWGPSLHWNSYLRQYVMLLNRAKDASYAQEGIYVSFNARLDNPTGWSAPVRILRGGSWYPQVIGVTPGIGTDRASGRLARFFMGGKSDYVIQFDR
jgi:hypothetical protein